MHQKIEQEFMQLAPIGVSTYNRLNHLKKTIEALQKNTLAEQSELYIFSDAPKKGDEEIVASIREYIHTVTGFKEVYIVEREINGIIANHTEGFEQLLNKYGKIIFLEDDNITSPYFLEYMNSALHFYKYDDRISSISGYCVPIEIPVDYKYDVFILHRFFPWGCGLWKDSYEKYFKEIDKLSFKKYFLDKNFINQIVNDSGTESLWGIESDALGKINAGDAKMIFWQNVYKVYTLYPRESLVENIGQDGSGVHMGISDKWDVKIGKKEKFEFVKNIEPDKGIRKLHRKFYSISKRSKLINILQRYGLHKYIYPFYKIIFKRNSK